MTYEDYWKMYNRCPKCQHYLHQIHCNVCIYNHPYMDPTTSWDEFVPTEECVRHMNRVIDGKEEL